MYTPHAIVRARTHTHTHTHTHKGCAVGIPGMTTGGGTIPGIMVPIIIGGTPGIMGIIEAAAIFIAAKSTFGFLAAGSSSSLPVRKIRLINLKDKS